ncbi:MAG: DUF4321 domain-containing protein [Lachnospiraceae bacterium]|nr:DUF4321 domain-containing protein [Lachnospiraceae bacterium]MBP3609098.1 DUF4321 domain-containing protein [Lachnospiraceae bacterium]
MKKDSLILLLLLLAGVVLGGFFGYLARDISWLSWLNYGQTFGFTGANGTPIVLDLGVLTLQFGIQIKITIASIIGIVVAFFLYRKM